MTSEGLGVMFEGDSADMCAGKFPLVSMGGRAEGLACADPGARTPIGASGNSKKESIKNILKIGMVIIFYCIDLGTINSQHSTFVVIHLITADSGYGPSQGCQTYLKSYKILKTIPAILSLKNQ